MSGEPEFYWGKWGWEAKDFGEVTFQKNERMQVVERNGEWWRGIFADGRNGWFPAARARPLTNPADIENLREAIAAYEKANGPIIDNGSTDKDTKNGELALLNELESLVSEPSANSSSKSKSKEAKSAKKSNSKRSKKEKTSNNNDEGEEVLLSPRGEPLPNEPIYVRAKWAWKAKANTELTMDKGEILLVTKKHGEWWKGKTLNGQHGWFPAARVVDTTEADTAGIQALSKALGVSTGAPVHVQKKAKAASLSSKSSSLSSSEPKAPQRAHSKSDKEVSAKDDKSPYFFAKWAWEPRAAGELAMNKGDYVRVSSRTDEWWKGRTVANNSGWFPKDRVRPLTDPDKLKECDRAFRKLAKQKAAAKAAKAAGVPAPAPPPEEDARPKTPPMEPGNFTPISALDDDVEEELPPIPELNGGIAAPPTPATLDEVPALPPPGEPADDPSDASSTGNASTGTGGLDALLDDLEGLEQASRKRSGNAVPAEGADKLDMSALDDLLDDLNPTSTGSHFVVSEESQNLPRASSSADRQVARQRLETARAEAEAAREQAAANKALQERAEEDARRQRQEREERERRDAERERAAKEAQEAAERERAAAASAASAAEQERMRLQQAREAAERESKRVAQETAERVERETRERVERETRERVERETRERVERETRERLEAEQRVREQREREEREAAEARERAAREADEQRKAEAAAAALRAKAEADAAAKLKEAEAAAALERERARSEAERVEAERKRAEEEAAIARKLKEDLARQQRELEEQRREFEERSKREREEREREDRERREAREREDREREQRDKERREREDREREQRDKERREREERERKQREKERREREEREDRERRERQDREDRERQERDAREREEASKAVRVSAAASVSTAAAAAPDTSDLDALLGDLDSIAPTTPAPVEPDTSELDNLDFGPEPTTSSAVASRSTGYNNSNTDNFDFGETLARSDSSKIARERSYDSGPAPPSNRAPSAATSRVSQNIAASYGYNSSATAARPQAAPAGALPSTSIETVSGAGGKRVTMTGLERDVLAALQLLHRNPGHYADLIERKRLPFFDGKSMMLTSASSGARMRYITSEGRAAADDCVRALRAAATALPMAELELSVGMTLAAKQGLPEDSSFGVIRDFGRFEGKVVECCAFEQETAEDIILQLLIDDGDAARTKRDMLMDRTFRFCGVAADSKRCLINLATKFIDN